MLNIVKHFPTLHPLAGWEPRFSHEDQSPPCSTPISQKKSKEGDRLQNRQIYQQSPLVPEVHSIFMERTQEEQIRRATYNTTGPCQTIQLVLFNQFKSSNCSLKPPSPTPISNRSGELEFRFQKLKGHKWLILRCYATLCLNV